MKESMKTFREIYLKQAVPALREQLDRKNLHALPKINRVVLSSGVAKHAKEGKFLEDVELGMMWLAGQKGVQTIAKKSIAGFKLREGQISGIVITLRGKRMEDFMQKLIHVVLPRVRDFRGVSSKNIDNGGNLTFGIREAQAFPEVDPQKIETIFGLQVTVVTSARTKEEAKLLLKSVGFPLTEADIADAKIQGPQKKSKRKKA